MKAVALVLLLVVGYMAHQLAVVENQRYALALGMCKSAVLPAPDFHCLSTVQTRTSWLWNLYYGLMYRP
jgi:hypothetical protein